MPGQRMVNKIRQFLLLQAQMSVQRAQEGERERSGPSAFPGRGPEDQEAHVENPVWTAAVRSGSGRGRG